MYLDLKCSLKRGYLRYKFLSYKPTQKEHVSCVVLEKGLLPWHLSSFEYVFTLGGTKPKCKVNFIFIF
jgi:hypothetical protein